MEGTGKDRAVGGRFIAGDPLRALAAVWIVAYHVCANALARTTANSSATDLSIELGEVGHFLSRAILSVYLFFGLSAYLLARPFVNAIVSGARYPRISSYARNRVLRIVPVFYVAFVATLLIRGREGEGWSEVLSVPLFAQMYDPSRFSEAIPQTWTLDVELLFYLLLPALGWLAVRLLAGRGTPDGRALAVLGFALVSAGASIALRTTADEWFEIIWLPGIWFSFAAGIAVAAAELLLRSRVTSPVAGRRLGGGLLAFAAAVLVYFVWGAETLLVGGLLGFAFVFAVILAPIVLQWTTGGCWRLFDNRPLHWLGTRSYSFYIWHVLVLWILSGPVPAFDGEPALTVAVLAVPGVPAVLLATTLSYRYIEEPFLRRKHLWRRGDQGAERGVRPPEPASVATPAGGGPA